MKTYLFFVLLLLIIGLNQQTFAAHDTSFPVITAVYERMDLPVENFLEVTNESTKHRVSWKERTLSKMIHKKVTKAKKSIQHHRKSKSLGGLLALVIVGLVLIPIGIVILLPLLIVGVVLLVLGITGTFLSGIGSIF
ncbi:hypothetical protein [Thermoflexibacter ruber]|uniref:Uncharacterized protein n=1 Tax=Thermoflexibacter ruber TaxID=1003 RepID=A0A1I2D425_9BACT|nr:hypothetical protein [Thermoflexibacter ruber]SFE75276.1 hypothetical protein SAMN04488541_100656 [Thermoflexibacter ruber]